MARAFYEGDLVSPPIRVLRSPEFNQEVNCVLAWWPEPSDGVIDKALTELYDRHKGRLVDYGGFEVDRETEDLALSLGGEDLGRYIRAHRGQIDQPGRYRVQTRLIRRVMLLYFATEIYIRRHYPSD